jgi:hypothetical protein
MEKYTKRFHETHIFSHIDPPVFIPWLLKDGVTTAEVTKMGMCCEMEYR